MRNSADYVVIGAGIIGCAITYYLIREGFTVCLLERAGFCAGSSSSTHTQVAIHNRFPGWDLVLSFKSIEILKNLSCIYDFEYEATGSLLLIESPNKLKWIEKTRKEQISAGIKSYFLTRGDLNREEPYLNRSINSAVFYPQSIRINSMLLCHALITDARRSGADVNLYTNVLDIVIKKQEIEKVKTSNGDVYTHNVINSAGAWSGNIGRMLGINIPIDLNKGQVVITEKLPELGIKMKSELQFKDEKRSSSGVNNKIKFWEKKDVRFTVSQTLHGNCLIGRIGENTNNLLDRSTSFLAIQEIISRAVMFMPILKDVKFIRTFAGFRPYSIDRKPLLGTSNKIKGFVVATGHGDRGIGWISTSKLLVDYLVGRKSFISINPFLFNRIEI